MTAPFFLSPGVNPQTLDLSGVPRISGTKGMAAAIIARRGSLKPKYISGRDAFLKHYGYPDPSWSLNHHAILPAIDVAPAWIKRVAKNARFAGLHVYNQRLGANGGSTQVTPFPTGSFKDYETGAQKIITIEISEAFVASNSIELTITDGTTPTAVGPVVFTTNHDNTVTLLAAAINAALGAYVTTGKNAGDAKAVVVTGADNDLFIRIICPEDKPLTVSSLAVTGGASQPVLTAHNLDTSIMQIFAENPGAWGNNIGIRFNNINLGTNQRVGVTLSGALITANTFNAKLTVNGVVTPITVAFTVDHATTLAAIKTAIMAALGVRGDVIYGTGSPILSFTIVAPDDGPSLISLTDAVVTGGVSQATVTVAQTVAGVASDSTFEIWVYERNNLVVPFEKFKVALKQQIDGFGVQQYIPDVINMGSSASSAIRIWLNTANLAATLSSLDTTAITFLSGGNDGTLPSASDVIAALTDFEDRTKYEFRILLGAGHVDVGIQTKMQSVCEKRRDAVAYLDSPSASQEVTALVDWRKNTQNINSRYTTLCVPDALIRDEFTDATFYVPSSGYFARQFTKQENRLAEMIPAAGLNYGVLDGIIGLRYEYNRDQRELLAGAQINPIVKFPGKGYAIFDCLTQQAQSSVTSLLPVSLLYNVIEAVMVDDLHYSLFNPLLDLYRTLARQRIEAILEPFHISGGIRRYEVVVDERNNLLLDEDLNQMNVRVYIDFARIARNINLQTILTRRGAVFSELVVE